MKMLQNYQTIVSKQTNIHRPLKEAGKKWLNNINEWTINQKMLVNESKSKTLIFNYTNNYQFTTRLKINDKPLEVIDSTRLLGTIISDDLKWDLNCASIVKKANARMELLRKVSNFCTNYDDLKTIYFLYIRSLLEQSATVWHSSLSDENTKDLERVQKSALKIILDDKYQGYKKALQKLEIESLSDRREKLCLNFAIKAAKNPKSKHMFPLNNKTHSMETRETEKFKVQHALTDRLKDSSVIFMQNLLNKNEDKMK